MDSTTATWHVEGSDHALSWGDSGWRLKLDAPAPGLYDATGRAALLTIDGLAATGRPGGKVLDGGCLVSVEHFRSRIQATYAPPDWGQLQLRASWSPTVEGDGLDLEVQVTAFSVGELRSVEVLVSSRPEQPGRAGEGEHIEVLPRDRRAAGLSYDGRESIEVLRRLTTTPVPEPGSTPAGAVSMASSGRAGAERFLEMVHPEDAARRMLVRSTGPVGASQVIGTCTGLFGLDLEKGVVLRGRLRVLRRPGAAEFDPEVDARAFQAFLGEPPPLGM